MTGPLEWQGEGISKEDGGLYIFSNQISTKQRQKKLYSPKVNAEAIVHDASLWHRRLGHPSAQVLRHLNLVHNNRDSEVLNKCSICPLAKQARLVFPNSTSRACISFDIVHMDLWGLIRSLR